MSESLYELFRRQGISRRSFLKFCSLADASMGLGPGHGCIGCSESDFWDKGPFHERVANHAVFREDIMSRQSTASTMFSGWHSFKDGRP
ncbi:MAG: twin-arginine translocation signal domain-containing protein [Myxococcales bacterium]|nr:twin-arginine translocation signal domain-containing protein [Myxococcales bacterium]